MEDLFVTQPSNSHRSLLLREPFEWKNLAGSINRLPLLQEWKPLNFEFKTLDAESSELPVICTVYVPGVLAFQADLKMSLFPSQCDELEFLPIMVAGVQWLLINCMKAVRKFDEEKSQVLRGLNGEIFMAVKMYVTDHAAGGCEMFTLADSNRTQLFVRSAMKERLGKLGLRGITFQRIGKVE